MASSWTRPADVRAALGKKWQSGVLLTAFASGLDWEPLGLPLRGPAPGEIGERLGEVQEWVGEWERAGRGPLRIEYKKVGGRHVGSNMIPGRAWIDGYDQAWALLGVRNQVHRLTELAEATRKSCPLLVPWVARRPMKALRLEARWRQLLATVRWIDQWQWPGMDTDAADFEGRYRFRRKPGYVRFRSIGFHGFSELSVRADEFTAAPSGLTRVYVLENEITYLALPCAESAMVIFGGGYAVPVLEPLDWLADLDLVYWGDIDTHGFAILDRLRQRFPHARSMLMDRATLLAHREQWVTEPSPWAASPELLDTEEALLYRDLVADVLGPSVRLEQERIRFGVIEQAMLSG